MENQKASMPAAQTPRAKDWALYIFVSSLPLIGIIMLFVWGFGNDRNINRSNWAKGMLLIYFIAIVFSLLFVFFFGGLAVLGLNDSH